MVTLTVSVEKGNVREVEAREGATARSRSRFVAYAGVTLALLIGVIVFGAWVRISGSGAGCGEHWPTCHGALLPPRPSTKTVIELSHRVTSALSGCFRHAIQRGVGRFGPCFL
jgi:heme A synthase